MSLHTLPFIRLFALVATVGAVGCDQPDPAANTVDAPLTSTEVDTDLAPTENTMKAMCELVPIGDSKVKGSISFTQVGDLVTIRGEVTGLAPGMHGFHVHEKGDLSDRETGKSAGGHFNPTDQPHGKMADQKRHVGDLGNIEADAEGVALINKEDSVISLTGDHSIMGLAIVIHADADDFTQPTGDAGSRVAFGKIEAWSGK